MRDTGRKHLKHLPSAEAHHLSSAFASPILAADTTPSAHLNAWERRIMLEDIGHVALVLGRSLWPDHPSLEPGDKVTASPAPTRIDALTSPLERLHFLCELWTRLSGALNDIARQPDSRATNTPRQIPLARSRGSVAAATTLARSPASATAWQTLQAARSSFPRPVHPIMPSQISMARISQVSVGPDDAVIAGFDVENRNSDTFALNMATGESALIAEPALASTQNTWANRMVVSLLKDMAQEAKALARLAAFCDDEAGEAKAARLANEVGRLLTGLFLRGCPALRAEEHDPPFAADLIARCAPAYGVVYKGWRTLHHPLDFDWTHAPMLALPSLEAWHLYEIWCCLQVGAALVSAGWEVEATNAQAANASPYPLLRCTPQGLRLNMATGRASRLRFRSIESGQKPKRHGRHGQNPETLDLYYQPLFSSANQTAFRPADRVEAAHAVLPPDSLPVSPAARKDDPALAFASRSHAMQPDIALHWRGTLTLLDPKYKRYAQHSDAQDDINKMHTYRDAIVSRTARGSKGATGTSGVKAAWCLFPGTGAQDTLSEGTRPDQMQDTEPGGESALTVYAYPTASVEHPFGTAGVGAFGLRPGQPDTLPRLTAFLTVLLNAE